MIIKLLKFLFGNIIGTLPAEDRERFSQQFSDLLSDVVTAAAKGAVEGAKK